jgi:hypothetical protein
MNPGGGPTRTNLMSSCLPEPGDPMSSFTNVRVADIAAFHPDAKSKGAQFLTGPLDRKSEIRRYLRDPDGYLIEIGQATGMLGGIYADQHAEDSTGEDRRNTPCRPPIPRRISWLQRAAMRAGETYSVSTRTSVSCSDTVVRKGRERLPGPSRQTHRRVGNTSPPA